MAKIILVTGGTRSGKSHLAKELAMKHNGSRMFVATATPFDDEMKERIMQHQIERGNAFETIEAPYDLPAALNAIPENYAVILVDCLTVWCGNLLYHFKDDCEAIERALAELKSALAIIRNEIILVTNEVGMGIVPENRLARRFRDMAGTQNREIACMADDVYLSVCGIPLKIK